MTLRRVLLGLAAIALLVAVGIVWHHVRAYRLVAIWLAQDCSVDEGDALETRLTRGGGAVESALIAAFEHGAPPEKRQVIAGAAGRQYDQTITALNASRSYSLSASEQQAIRDLTREAFVSRSVDAGDRRYRSAALRGLAIVSRPNGLALVRRVASDAHSPFRQLAIAALASAVGRTASP